MNWKYKLLIFTILVTAVVIFVKLPSQADKNVESATNTVAAPIVNGEFTEYANGIVGIAPHGFAISKPVKEMLAQDPDALRSRALFVRTKEQKRAARLEKLRAQGLSEEEIEIDQINIRNARTIKKIVPGAGLAEGKFKDPLVDEGQKSFELQTMPTPSLTFRGASQSDNAAQGVSGIVPPDANGDVGPNHYVSAVNLVFKVFDKTGNVLAGPVINNSLFQNLPAGDPCRITNDGDPIILYDSLADRWHFSQFAIPTSGTTSYQCVALSVTGDPTGAYYVWSYAYPGSLGNDFPKVGVWTDGYHMTFNQFSSLEPDASFVGLGILTQDRKKALAGDPATIAVYNNVGELDPDSGGALPGDIDGFVAPPEGLAQVIGEFRANDFGDPVDGLRLYRWAPDFLNPGNSTLIVLPDLALAEFDARQPRGLEDIEQAGGSKLDSVSDRSMHRFAYRNLGTATVPKNSYVGNFAVNVSGVNPVSAETYQSAIRWFEVRRTNDTFSVFDQGTHQSGSTDGVNGLNNWMGAIAQDNQGNIALGYSQASITQNADIKIAGRTIPKSGGLNEGEALFFDATGSQTGSNRWGDYSSMNVDPVDDCTFYYTQEYYETISSTGWSTRVGKFKFPQCTPPPTATIKGTVTFCDNNQPVDKASVNATGGFNRITGANGVTGEYEIKVSPGTYAVTAGRAGGLVSASGAKDINVGPGETAFANFCLNGVAIIATNVEPRIVSESCSLPNGVPDPSEQVTVSLPLQNTGAASTTNLTAELQATGGVTNPSTPQNYGALAPGSVVASKNFTFTVAPNIACGSTITLTFKITDGSTDFGTITKTFVTGVLQPTRAQNFDSVTAPALPTGWENKQIVGTGINWVTSTVSPSSPPNTAFANNAAFVSAAALVTPPIQIEIADAQFSFKNFFETEDNFDGMVLEYSTDGTNYIDIIRGGGSFVSGGYNGVISRDYDSPIKGRNAWTGNSNGFINTVVNLPASLKGQSVRFRWLMASDISFAEGAGVRIDDVQYFGKRECAACVPGTVCQASQTKSRYDFDGDRKSDLSVFRPSNNTWYLRKGDGGFTGIAFGLSSDKLVPADYDGDNKTDVAVYRDGTWYLQRSRDGFIGVAFGVATDIPQPADFNGDGKADLAVFRPSNGTWYVYNLANDQVSSKQFGAPTDKPVVGDYDGDCKADYAVFRPAEGNWYVQRSKDGFLVQQFGAAGDKLVPADYDGDGKTDIAVFRPSPSNGTWYLLQSAAGLRGVTFGFGTDLPVPADYDGDGKADVAVFRNGIWYQLQSTGGFKGEQFGEAADKPIPNVFIQQ